MGKLVGQMLCIKLKHVSNTLFEHCKSAVMILSYNEDEYLNVPLKG